MREVLVDARFQVEQEIGNGPMGRVHRAVDRVTGAKVAVRIFRVPPERYLQDYRLAQAISPAIVAEGKAPDGRPYVATEWLDGFDLRIRLRVGRLHLDEVFVIVRSVACALGAVPIAHGDLSPSNVFLVKSSPHDVRILDFGGAALKGVPRLTETTWKAGAPKYASRERARGAPPSTLSDIYSLGAIAFHCLSGKCAVDSRGQISTVAQIIVGDVPTLSSVMPELPPRVLELVDRMMAREPERRPQSWAEVEREWSAQVPPGSKR